MQFSSAVEWNSLDFLIMGILLTGTGFLSEITFRLVKTVKSRIILISTILFVFILVWAELAVGIFGTPFAGS